VKAGAGAAIIALCLPALLPYSAGAATAEEAQALVERATKHVLEVGHDRAFADFDLATGNFVVDGSYVFCLAPDGTTLAHGGNPKLIGKNLMAVRDRAGRSPVAEILRIARDQGRGWVEYLWPNPAAERIVLKRAYVIRVDDNAVCVAGYEPATGP
jgi:signal transduction histidine kinase